MTENTAANNIESRSDGHTAEPVAKGGKLNENVNNGYTMDGDILASHHLEPLWLKMNAMVPPTPNPVASPHIWRYEETLPHLLEAGRTVPPEAAERRVLMLVNPKMGKFEERKKKTEA